MNEQPETRYSLLARIADPANAAAWGEFVALYEPLLYRYARSRGCQDADARDLCQTVFRSVAGAIERWTPDPSRGAFRAWLFRIARNAVVNLMTRQRIGGHGAGGSEGYALLLEQPATDGEESACFDQEYQREVFQTACASIREEFAQETWNAFWQTAVEQREPASVAAALGKSVGAIYIARSRVLARLKQRVGEITGSDM